MYKESKGDEGFKADLHEAHIIENNLKEILEDNYECTVESSQSKGQFSKWDLKAVFKDGDLTIEVKEDKMVCMTGNIALELCRIIRLAQNLFLYRDTCLSKTEADCFAYYFNNTYYLVPTDELKQLVNNEEYLRITSGGDALRAKVALFPLALFMKHVNLIFKNKSKWIRPNYSR